MKTVWLASLTSVFSFLLAIPNGHAADTMKAFPRAASGMVRYVLQQLPPQENESLLKVELLVGKTV